MRLFSAAFVRLRQSLPNGGMALRGSLGWAAAMAACALAGLMMRGWQSGAQLAEIGGIFAAGGFLAFAPALVLARFLSLRRKLEAAFAAHLASLAFLTIGVTALISGLVFRDYYAAWHGPFLSKLWILQFVFTIASGVYQFLVIGLPLYFPFGLPMLLAAAYFLVGKPAANPNRA